MNLLSRLHPGQMPRMTRTGRRRKPLRAACSAKHFFIFALSASLAATGCGSPSSEADHEQEDPQAAKPAAADVSETHQRRDPQQPQPERPRQEPAAAETQASPERLLQQAQQLAASGDRRAARDAVQKLLVRDPGNVAALFLAGNLEAAAGNWDQAVAMLDEIPADHPQAALPALGQSADWLMQAERWREAERRYRKILQLKPDAGMAHRRLAQLLNRQGRRQEAAEHVMRLCRAGDVSEPELHSLISIPDSFYDDQNEQARITEAPIGPLGKARIAFSEGRLSDATKQLASAAEERSLTGPEAAFYGRVLAEQQLTSQMPSWLESCPPEAAEFGDYWAALGMWMLLEGDYEKAIDFFGEAVFRVPTDRISFNRLSESLKYLGKDEASERCRRRGDLLVQTHELATEVGMTETADPEIVDRLADVLERLKRPVEAVMWRAIAASYRGNAQQVLPQLNQQRLALIDQPQDPPTQWLLCGLHREAEAAEAAVARLGGTSRRPDASGGESPKSWPATFANIAPDVGVKGRFYNKVEQTDRFTLMHHGIGGGVAVIDFDLNGRPDLYFPQGASVPDQWEGKRPNQLYRNLVDRFEWTTEQAGVDDRGFGQGATAGDFNADGFPDLFVANIGRNRLFLNNGDGTFRDATTLIQQDPAAWTTSVAIADINGDHLADLVESNYVGDPSVFQEPPTTDPETGEPLPILMPRPGDFRADGDWLHASRGDASTESSVLKLPAGQEFGDALAILISDIDGRGGNEIFVANDMRPNHYWTPKRDSDTSRMVETGVLSGCAYSARGNANACMGIAAGDFTDDGQIDLAVTNFYKEPMNLYVQSSPGRFTDAAARYNLFETGYDVNGFGTQAIDYDNNGALDIAVLNGHIHDNSAHGHPFRMRPQLFDGSGQRFELASVADPSGYWQTPSLARALAKLDWNRDGRMDLVTTHLDLPHGLLENRTDSPGHWLQLRLVGTTSERDAIGARISVIAEGKEWVETVNTGDGFECKNEAVVAFGLGETESIETLKVTWPSGQAQVFDGIKADRRWLIVENDDQPFELASDSSR